MEKLAWITGAHGLIGSHLVREVPACGFRVRPLTRHMVDLRNHAAVAALYRRERPALIIHAAALSKSPACEADPALAYALNVDVTRLLAELAADTPFIFFSTDLIFDGQRGNYSELAPTNPLSMYGETKVHAERFVLANPRHTVVRTSLNAGRSPTGDRGFNEELRRVWHSGLTLTLFQDEFRSPIPAKVTARAVWELASQNAPGLYHLAGAERLSRFEIGNLLAKRWTDLKPHIQPGSLRDYQGPPRAPDTSLNSAKIQSRLSFALPSFSTWLEIALPDDV